MPEQIRMLGRDVVERIAAGEVIERPASVVRELVANALDAGATTIRIELHDGGLRLIRVADDGEGVQADDLPLAVASHATSKVRELADLQQVVTLGFRGEALASIAAVAEMEIASAADDSGLARVLRAGPDMTPETAEAPRTRGTSVTVRDLFATVPARRALLRGPRVEAGRVLAVVRGCALAHPAVRFTVVADRAVLLQTPGSSLADAVAAIYGSDAARSLLSLSRSRVGDATIAGVVAARAFHTATREHVLLIVNGRPVANRSLLTALEAGYRPLLRKGRHPLLIAALTVPPDQVDVNIHPAKAEVLLRHEQVLAPALREAVHVALAQSPLSALGHAGDDIAAGRFPRPVSLVLPSRRFRRAARLAERRRSYVASADDAALDAGEWEPLAQFDETLILARTAAGHLLLVDQHRAHERILYERLLRRRDARRAAGAGADADMASVEESAQMLLQPVLVELSPLQARQLEPRLDELRALGLDCQPFGGSVFLVRAVPHLPGMVHDAAAVAATLAEDAATDSNDWLDVVCVSLACRTAIRRGQALTPEEQRALLADLRGVAVATACPHGSPLLLRYSRGGLARAFEW
ncbi:MAG TPA: DNA mismatch repair endonuclease MutL [Ktedonobacterales bacterium]|nr:DNA mismatch repair endonuclease MutL [Ktedonobacterales bacterium]